MGTHTASHSVALPQTGHSMGCQRLFCCFFFLLPVILSSTFYDDLSLDTARHKLDPEVIPNHLRESALKQFKNSLDHKKKQLHKKKIATDLKKGYAIHKNKVVKKPSTVEQKTSDDENLIQISNSTTNSNSSAPFSWIRNKLSFIDLSRTVNNMVDSSSKSVKNMMDSFTSTLWHMTMPAHIAV